MCTTSTKEWETVDDILKKFKELTFKEQLGIYAGIVLFIAAFLPFKGFDFGGFGSANYKLASTDLGFLAWAGAGVGAVCIFLKQELIAAIGFAAAALSVIIGLISNEGLGGGLSIKYGAFVCIAAAAVGVWATIDALIAKLKK
jgi:hypothetical protein